MDPKKEIVIVYDFENENFPLNYTFDDEVPVNIYGGELKIDFRVIKEMLIATFGEDYGVEL